MPAWWRSKCRPDGVMMPNRFCSGVNATDECGVRVSPGLSRRCTFFSYFDGTP